MFLLRTTSIGSHIFNRNTRYFSGINHIGKYTKHVPTTRASIKPQIRLNFNKAESEIERQLAAKIREPRNLSLLVRPFLFMVGTSAAAIVGATVWEYEYIRSQVKKMMFSSSTFFPRTEQKQISDMDGFVKGLGAGNVSQAWSRLSHGDQFYVPILAANLIIFGLWRSKRLQPRLLKSFTGNPYGQAPCRSMLLSTFSHYSFFHIFANMYVLHSFSNGITYALGKEQAIAMYLSAGCFSSFVSYAHKVLTGVNGGSIGASGAILGVLGYICTKFPDTELQIMFLPMVRFAAEDAIIGLMLFDMIGLAMGWKMFDHAAHLGGALFGIFWCLAGEELIWKNRKYITEKLHEFRKTIR